MATTGPALILSHPRPVTVYVIINDASQNDVKLQSADVPVVQDFIIQFSNNQGGIYSPGFLVDFFLPDTLGENASWTFDAADPIWVKLVDKHGGCPRKKHDNQPGILTAPTLSNGNRTLTVGNANAVVQYFGFTLRFQNTETGKPLTHDPIGANQNGQS